MRVDGESASGRALVSWRKARCVELALAGYSYDEIAEQVGYANRGNAWRTVQEALSERKVESVDEYRELELARLDAIQAAHWAAAISGTDIKAAELVLKTSYQRSKLLGLELMPGRTPTTATVVIGGSKDEYIAGLKEISGKSASQ